MKPATPRGAGERDRVRERRLYGKEGVAGSVIGGTIANLIGTGDVMELNVVGFIVAVLCSVGLLAAAERAGLGQRPDRKRLGHS